MPLCEVLQMGEGQNINAMNYKFIQIRVHPFFDG